MRHHRNTHDVPGAGTMKRWIVGLVLMVTALAGCSTYRYLPGGEEASRTCDAKARQDPQVRKSDVGIALVGPVLGGAQARYDRWLAVYEPCMTEHGFPPGAPVREKVK